MKVLLIFLIIVIISVGILFMFPSCVKSKNKILEQKIERKVERWTIMRFEIIKRDDNHITIKYQFYDAESNPIMEKVKYCKILGNELAINFAILEMMKSKEFFVFPTTIYSNETSIEDGYNIFNDYKNDNLPLIYFGEELKRKEIKKLKIIFNEVVQQIENKGQNDSFLNNKNNKFFYRSIYDLAETGWKFNDKVQYSLQVHYNSNDIRLKEE